MDRKQQNRYDMFIATHRFLLEHESAWPGNQMLLGAVARLKQLIDALAVTNGIMVNPEGAALRTRREDALAAAMNALTEISAVTSNWAADVPEEKVLYKLVSTQGYQLMRMGQSNRVERMKAMLDAAEAAAPRVPGNPLDVGVYLRARNCLKTYVDLDGAARNSDAQRIAARGQLPGLIKECAELLKRVDRMLKKFQSDQPELHARYMAVRNILDLGGSSKRAAGRAVRKAEKAAQKAHDAALVAAEAARIADEEAKNRARLAELKKSLNRSADGTPAAKHAEDATPPLLSLPPADSVQAG